MSLTTIKSITDVLVSIPFTILLLVLTIFCIVLAVASATDLGSPSRNPAKNSNFLLDFLFKVAPKDEASKQFLRKMALTLVLLSVGSYLLNPIESRWNPPVPSPTPPPATVVLVPSATTGATSVSATHSLQSPTVVPTPSPTPPPDILYQANWSTGKDGWVAPCTCQSDAAWSVVNGELVSSGQTVYDPTASGFSTDQAPYQPGEHGIQDYAVEAKILVISKIPNEKENAFGIGVRRYYDTDNKKDQGYGWRAVSNTQSTDYIAIYLQPSTIPPGGSAAFDPHSDWHTYRIEVRGSDITVFVDGNMVLYVVNGEFTHGGKVEIWEEFDRIEVQSFTISRL